MNVCRWGPARGAAVMGSLRVGEGDLLLCRDCDKVRHRLITLPVTMFLKTLLRLRASKTEIPSSEGSITSKRAVEVNELLCFLRSKFNTHPLSLIKENQLLISTVKVVRQHNEFTWTKCY